MCGRQLEISDFDATFDPRTFDMVTHEGALDNATRCPECLAIEQLESELPVPPGNGGE